MKTDEPVKARAWTPGPFLSWPNVETHVYKHFVCRVAPSPHRLVGMAYGETAEEAQANGQLFAAAPELYEALEQISTALREDGAIDLVKARAALAKARGEK